MATVLILLSNGFALYFLHGTNLTLITALVPSFLSARKTWPNDPSEMNFITSSLLTHEALSMLVSVSHSLLGFFAVGRSRGTRSRPRPTLRIRRRAWSCDSSHHTLGRERVAAFLSLLLVRGTAVFFLPGTDPFLWHRLVRGFLSRGSREKPNLRNTLMFCRVWNSVSLRSKKLRNLAAAVGARRGGGGPGLRHGRHENR